MAIATDRDGNVLLEFCAGAEEALCDNDLDAPLTHALVVAECSGRYLLVHSIDRDCWQLPGGVIEPGETPRECVVRELEEETGQDVDRLTFEGLFKVQMEADGRVAYGALFAGRIVEVQPFEPTDEIDQILLWDTQADIGEVSQIGEALLDYA